MLDNSVLPATSCGKVAICPCQASAGSSLLEMFSLSHNILTIYTIPTRDAVESDFQEIRLTNSAAGNRC